MIDGYQPVTGSSVSVDGESTVCTVSFRDYSDQVISLPSAFKISKSINSGKIYDQLNMLLFTGKRESLVSNSKFSVCDAPEFQLYYSNQSGDCCSRCGGLTTCTGCLVPENFDIELKRYDHFKVIFTKVA